MLNENVLSNKMTIEMPAKPEWKFCFAGNWEFTFHTKSAPHWLARTLMKWLLDIHWEKIDVR